MDVSEFEGGAIRISLSSQDRQVTAIVPTADSEAREDGYDFVFMVLDTWVLESFINPSLDELVRQHIMAN